MEYYIFVVIVQVHALSAGCIKYAASSILGVTPARRWLMCARAAFKIRCALLKDENTQVNFNFNHLIVEKEMSRPNYCGADEQKDESKRFAL